VNGANIADARHWHTHTLFMLPRLATAPIFCLPACPSPKTPPLRLIPPRAFYYLCFISLSL